MSDESPITFALVGCGRIAQRHAEHIARCGRLVAVCDTDPIKAHELARHYQARVYDSIESLLAARPRPEVVSVCTPNGLHARHSILALRAGCHVLCEKPLALTVPDGEAMIAEASRANRRLFAVKQNRFNPPVVAVKKLLADGSLGRVFSVGVSCFWNRPAAYYHDWHGTPDLDGGTLFTQFSHFVDLLYYLLGDVDEVLGFRGNLAHQGLIAFEDTGVVALRFRSGALGTLNYTVNSYERNMEGSLTIFAEKGTVKIGGHYLNELEYQCIGGLEITGLPPGNGANQYGTYQGSMSNHGQVYQNVVEVLRGRAEIAANSADALKTVEIIRKIYAATGGIQNESV